eukprot:Hpha_TRINITY_DN20036_c0_g1::TRINITY_DN20036_c0_g1_i1::g.147806::m.147806
MKDEEGSAEEEKSYKCAECGLLKPAKDYVKSQLRHRKVERSLQRCAQCMAPLHQNQQAAADKRSRRRAAAQRKERSKKQTSNALVVETGWDRADAEELSVPPPPPSVRQELALSASIRRLRRELRQVCSAVASRKPLLLFERWQARGMLKGGGLLPPPARDKSLTRDLVRAGLESGAAKEAVRRLAERAGEEGA